MALKSAYNYVRENIDSNFDKYVEIMYLMDMKRILKILRDGYLKKGKTLR